jgi:hypothetical protein
VGAGPVCGGGPFRAFAAAGTGRIGAPGHGMGGIGPAWTAPGGRGSGMGIGGMG